jgi:hypothetical protein
MLTIGGAVDSITEPQTLRACHLARSGVLVQARGVYGLAFEVWSVLRGENGRGSGLTLNRRTGELSSSSQLLRPLTCEWSARKLRRLFSVPQRSGVAGDRGPGRHWRG